MRVSVFGGTHTRPGDKDYDEAVRLGRLLGERGCTVITGGYIGVMEAVSRGAAEAGAHVIGVTCDEIERFRPGKPNAWVKEEQRFPDLVQRLNALIEGCDAAIALPGGVGTLAEIMTTWNHSWAGSFLALASLSQPQNGRRPLAHDRFQSPRTPVASNPPSSVVANGSSR